MAADNHKPSDFAHPFNPGNPLGYQTGGTNATKFALYNANDPMRTLRINTSGNLTTDGSGDPCRLGPPTHPATRPRARPHDTPPG